MPSANGLRVRVLSDARMNSPTLLDALQVPVPAFKSPGMSPKGLPRPIVGTLSIKADHTSGAACSSCPPLASHVSSPGGSWMMDPGHGQNGSTDEDTCRMQRAEMAAGTASDCVAYPEHVGNGYRPVVTW